MKHLKIVGILSVCLLLSAGVYAGMVSLNIVQFPWRPAKEPDIQGLNDPMNDFAIKLYKELAQNKW